MEDESRPATIDRARYEVLIARLTRRNCDCILRMRDAEAAGEIAPEQVDLFVAAVDEAFNRLADAFLPGCADRPKPDQSQEPQSPEHDALVLAFSSIGPLRQAAAQAAARGKLSKADRAKLHRLILGIGHELSQALRTPEPLPGEFLNTDVAFLRLSEIAGVLRAEARYGVLPPSEVPGLVRAMQRFADQIKEILKSIDERDAAR